MKKIIFNCGFLFALRFLIGAMFVYSGAIKVSESQQFADTVASFQILPKILINILALGLPPVEILAGAMMISGGWSRPATLCVLVLTVIFALALGYAIARGLQVDCGCFGSGKSFKFQTWISLGRDLLILIGSALLYINSLKITVEKRIV